MGPIALRAGRFAIHVCLVLVIGGFLAWVLRALAVPQLGAVEGASSPKTELIPGLPIPIDEGWINGHTVAPVGMIIFSDFECPDCARFARNVWPSFSEEFVGAGKVRVSFHHLPLPEHPHAFAAAVASDCAGMQGQFWSMHDSLFRGPAHLEESDILLRARQLNLVTERFVECRTTSAGARVNADIALAARLGVSSTPTFFLGKVSPEGPIVFATHRIAGVATTQNLREVVDVLSK